jgi:hypothetical protein
MRQRGWGADLFDAATAAAMIQAERESEPLR